MGGVSWMGNGTGAERRARLGAWASAGGVVVFTMAVALPGPEHLRLGLFLAVATPACLLALAFVLAAKTLDESPNRFFFFYGWNVATVALISAAVALTGGGKSVLYLLYAGTLIVAAAYYPTAVQCVLGAAVVAAYTAAVAVDGWDITGAALLVRTSTMALVFVMTSAIAREKDRIARESARRASLLTAVTGVARDMNLLEGDKVFESVAVALGQLGFGRSHVSLLDEATGTYRLVHSKGVPEAYTMSSPPSTAGIVGMVREAKGTIILDGEGLKDYLVPVLNTPVEAAALIGSPLWVDGKLAGVLVAAGQRPGAVGPEEVEAFELLAGVASRALEGARRYQEISESEARSRYQANHDDLTGLANRSLLHVRLREALSQTGPGAPKREVALLLVDLHDFKLVNDTLGHGAADQVLSLIAGRLVECVRDSDTVARMPGDEFAVLVAECDRADLGSLATRLLQVVSEPGDIDGNSISVDASIGIAVKSAGALGNDELESAAADLLSNADVAMYEAKRAGMRSYVVFDQWMADRVRRRMTIGAELPKAVESGEMSVHYQPIFELETRAIAGFEALLRWSHHRLGLLAPAEFIPLAEETGAIVQIGRWVLSQACAELVALRNLDPAWSGLNMSINLSARQLRDPGLVEEVLGALEAAGLPAGNLTLEITESSLLRDAASSQAKLAALGALGVRVALDDFGTGYSSLAYLQQLQVHTLKIDKTFVDGLEPGRAASTELAVIRSITELSDALSLDTVAEGIETENQLAELRRLGCRLGQGYVFSPAVPPERLPALLWANSSVPPPATTANAVAL